MIKIHCINTGKFHKTNKNIKKIEGEKVKITKIQHETI